MICCLPFKDTLQISKEIQIGLRDLCNDSYLHPKDVMWLARKLQKKLEDLLMENRNNVPELMKYSRNFEATTDYFKKAVDKKYRVYANVYNFYLTSQKVTHYYTY